MQQASVFTVAQNKNRGSQSAVGAPTSFHCMTQACPALVGSAISQWASVCVVSPRVNGVMYT